MLLLPLKNLQTLFAAPQNLQLTPIWINDHQIRRCTDQKFVSLIFAEWKSGLVKSEFALGIKDVALPSENVT